MGAEPQADGEQVPAGDAHVAATSARFQEFYRAHFDFVFRNLCRLGVPRALADDALQDVFIVVLRKLPEFAPEGSPRAWLFAIAFRVASDYRRSERRRGRVRPSPDIELAEHAGPSPFDEAAQHEAVDRLHGYLERLRPERRVVFIMTELEQLSAPEISSALGVNLNTVYTRLRAARRDMARLVAEDVAEAGRAHVVLDPQVGGLRG